MKVIILCGGLGSRLAEETKIIPKPMIKIGNLPMLSHIIKIYNHFGFKDFILATGYKSNIIENYYKKSKNIRCLREFFHTNNSHFIGRKFKKILFSSNSRLYL